MVDKRPKRKWFDSVKDVIFVEDEKRSEEPTAQVQTTPGTGSAPSFSPTLTVDQSMVKKIRSEVEEANTDDGLGAFFATLAKLEPVISDEKTRFQAALATTAGITLVQIRTGLSKRISSLEAEEREFEQELSEQIDGATAEKKRELLNVQRDIKGKLEQITELTEQIRRLEEEKRSLEQGIAADDLRKKNTRAAFKNAKEYLKALYEDMAEKTQKYLG